MRRLFLPIMLLLSACSNEALPQLTPGGAAPSFSALALDGRQQTFPGEFSGRPLAIVFWSEACPPCVRELQDIEQGYRRRTANPVQIVAINVGQDKASTAALVYRLDLGFPVLLDEDGAIAHRYGVVGLPTSYFVDAAGIIRSKLVGEADTASFMHQALDLIAASAVTPR